MADRDDDDDDDDLIERIHPSPPAKRIKWTNPESNNPLITAESVKTYLGEHPDFLDSYIEQNIPSNILEEWISKKVTQKSTNLPSTSISNSTTTTTTDFNVNRKHLSKTISSTTANSMHKLAELSDKRRLLHELTDEVNQNVSKAQILYELSKSISSTVLADGFNLYLVDETGRSMRLFNAENDDEQAACFIPIRIDRGHCLAGYVAYAKQTIRLNDINELDKEKYPDGLYVKDDKVTAVMAHPIINATGTLLGVVEFYRIDKTSPFTDEDEEEILKCVNELFTQTYYEVLKKHHQ